MGQWRTLQEKAVAAVVMVMLVNSAAGQMIRFFDESFNVKEGDEFTVRVELLGTITENVRVIVEVSGSVPPPSVLPPPSPHRTTHSLHQSLMQPMLRSMIVFGSGAHIMSFNVFVSLLLSFTQL